MTKEQINKNQLIDELRNKVSDKIKESNYPTNTPWNTAIYLFEIELKNAIEKGLL